MNVSDLAMSFGIDRRTIHNYISTYEVDGLEGLRPNKNYRGKINNELISFIQKLQTIGNTLTHIELNRELSRKFNLTISENTIKKLVRAELIKPINADIGATKNYEETEFGETFILETEKEKVEYGILYTKHKMTGDT